MGKKIRQIELSEALELVSKGERVNVLSLGKTVTVKSFSALSVGAVFDNESNYLFFVIEEE